jgi:hypothetical protein
MPVQFGPDGQAASSNGAASSQQPGGSPEGVRKKWDALLNVINNVSADTSDAPGRGSDPSQRPPLRAARELVSDSSAAAKFSPAKGRRKEWNDRHGLMYSAVNSRMQKNIRSYFDRPRDIESYGLRYDEPLRTSWQLDTPEVPPPPGTLRGHYAKFNNTVGSSGLLPALADGSPSQGGSPESTGMSRSQSDPGYKHKMRENGWDGRHAILFSKDNHHYHGNLREYFERPRAVLH